MHTRLASIARRVALVGALSALAFAAATPATAQAPAAAQDAGSTPALGPPSWVVAGTRISHASSVASVDNAAYELVEDPNGPLEDPATGTRYRESFVGGTSPVGGSGEAVLEATVVALDGLYVVLARVQYARDALNGGFSGATSSGERVPGYVVPGLWFHPDLLAAYQPGEGSPVRVLRGETTLGGVTYQAVSLVDPTPGAYSSFTYDTATGLLLASALRISGGPGSTTQLSTTELLGVRQTTVPGLGAPVPDWLRPGTTLDYAGTTEFANPLDPAGFVQTYPMTLTASFPETGPTWARYETAVSVDMGGSPIASAGAGVVGGAGPYWWDPAALAGFTTGQVLDSDPYTGLTFTVSEPGQGPAGPAVGIVARMPGIDMEAYYDIGRGVMIAQAVSSASSGITSRNRLLRMP